ncbi:MAG: type I 3-dehydroquinate dehydratase [Chthoniobacterales bacterium]
MANHKDKTGPLLVKARPDNPKLVAVIASWVDLASAQRLRHLPDFFELRLDGFGDALAGVEEGIARLGAPLIITARHPTEGGLRNLSAAARRILLSRFLPSAAAIDVELRSVRALRVVLEEARAREVDCIISVHDFLRPFQVDRARAGAEAARALAADIFKIAVRTETRTELDQLISFVREEWAGLPIAAMGIGRFGRASRITLARQGSVLTYVHLGTAQVAGQLSLNEMRRALRRAGST